MTKTATVSLNDSDTLKLAKLPFTVNSLPTELLPLRYVCIYVYIDHQERRKVHEQA